jgi:hypothetical protein
MPTSWSAVGLGTETEMLKCATGKVSQRNKGETDQPQIDIGMNIVQHPGPWKKRQQVVPCDTWSELPGSASANITTMLANLIAA